MHLEYPIRSDKFSHRIEITDSIASVQSDFQRIDILETPCFGRILLLDNHIQLATLDEHAYHEALVHIPLLNVPNPRRALVVGGGDGGVLRELLKYPQLEEITMIEIDDQVVETCKAHLPTVSDGAFDNPRVNLVIGDAFPFVKESKSRYDLIVVDATDTYEDEEGELSEMLFTHEFYRDCDAILTDDGFVVTQADNHLYCPYSLEEISNAFAKVWPKVGSYWTMVPSFGGFSAYCYGTRSGIISATLPDSSKTIALKSLNEHSYALGQKPLFFG